MIIAVLLSIAALYLGRQFFIPIALAVMFHGVLRRPVRLLEALHVPTALGALLVVVGVLASFVLVGWVASGPVQDWFEKAPAKIVAAQQRIRQLGRPVQRLAQAATSGGDSAAAARGAPRAAAPAPAAGPPGMVTQALGASILVLGAAAEVVLLLYLLLSSGDLFLRKLLNVLPRRHDQRAALDVLHQAEGLVVRYLVFSALIAAGQGVAVGLVVWALGMSDPWMWALATAVLEMIPYLGAAVMVIVLSLSALTTFDSVGHALLAPAAYLVISAIQNNVVTPLVFSGRMRLNSVAVLVGVVFWYFLWGVPGAFLAIPILAMAKALSDEIPQLKPLGEFLGD